MSKWERRLEEVIRKSLEQAKLKELTGKLCVVSKPFYAHERRADGAPYKPGAFKLIYSGDVVMVVEIQPTEHSASFHDVTLLTLDGLVTKGTFHIDALMGWKVCKA